MQRIQILEQGNKGVQKSLSLSNIAGHTDKVNEKKTILSLKTENSWKKKNYKKIVMNVVRVKGKKNCLPLCDERL